jgi:hypothetical protein
VLLSFAAVVSCWLARGAPSRSCERSEFRHLVPTFLIRDVDVGDVWNFGDERLGLVVDEILLEVARVDVASPAAASSNASRVRRVSGSSAGVTAPRRC